MKLFIDFHTGTWGTSNSVVIFDTDDVPLDETEGQDVLDFLESASDSDINNLGFAMYQRQFKD